ncbi:hypothetical protein HDU67_004757 [Dinochytrium kinnereticum]|nr:hypothetical protein HDU67_004757 [Dinochytrium kinnereticum]
MSFAPPPGPPPEDAVTAMAYAPPPGAPPPLSGGDMSFAPPPGPPPADAPSPFELAEMARKKHLGHFSALTDVLIHGIIATLDAKSLTTLSRVNKTFYIFARDDSVWRSLCIRAYSTPKSMPSELKKKKLAEAGLVGEEPVLSFKGNWRFTYYFPAKTLGEDQAARLERARSIRASPITPPFFSDFLYNKAVRNNMNLGAFVPDFGSGTCVSVPVVNDKKKKENAAQEFRKRFDATSTPVLIKGGFEYDAESWGLENLKKKFGTHRFSIGTEEPSYLHHGAASEPMLVDMAFEDYLEYMKTQSDECPLYVFDGSYGEKAPEMLSYYKTPRFFEEDFLSVLGDRRPPYRWIVAGPARSGASWHVDPLYTSAWNALVTGRKRWCLYPPTMVPPGVVVESGKKGFDAPSALHWFLDVYPRIPLEYKPLEIVQEAGDVIFVPAGWWHAVLNLDEVNVAVTQNFVGEANLEKLLAELLMQKQIKNFEELRGLLTAAKPELRPAFLHIHHLFGEVKDPLIIAEGCGSRAEYFDSFNNLRLWMPRIAEVWRREFEGEMVPGFGEVFPIQGGSNPVFLHPATSRILKFYAHLDGGLTTHAVESYVLQAMTQAEDPKVRSSVPRLIRSGRLLDEAVDEKGVTVAEGKWSWPFIIMSRLGGDEHIPIGGWEWKVRATAADEEEGAEKELRKRTRAVGEEEGETQVEKQDISDHWANTVKWIAETLKSLHAVRPEAVTVKGSNPKDRRVYKTFVRSRIEGCLMRHKELGSLPKHLLDEIESRLPEFEALALSELESLGPDCVFTAGLLHGDMNPGNVLGTFTVDEPATADAPKVPATFKPQFLIDFGDALASEEGAGGIDALWDLGGTYVGILKCQPQMLDALMNAYTGGRWSAADVAARMRLRERMLVLTLVCGHHGYIRYAVRAAGGTKRLEAEGITWERLVVLDEMH